MAAVHNNSRMGAHSLAFQSRRDRGRNARSAISFSTRKWTDTDRRNAAPQVPEVAAAQVRLRRQIAEQRRYDRARRRSGRAARRRAVLAAHFGVMGGDPVCEH